MLCPIICNPESQTWSNTCIGMGLIHLAFDLLSALAFSVCVCRAGKREFDASFSIFELDRVGSTFYLRE